MIQKVIAALLFVMALCGACSTRSPGGKGFECRIVSEGEIDGSPPGSSMQWNGSTIVLGPAHSFEISFASIGKGGQGYSIMFAIAEADADRFTALTRENVGKRLAMLVNDELIDVSRIMGLSPAKIALSDLDGKWSKAQVEEIVKNMHASK